MSVERRGGDSDAALNSQLSSLNWFAKSNRPPGVDPAGEGVAESYFFFFFAAAASATAVCAASVLAARCWNLSTRPAVSTNFCWPV